MRPCGQSWRDENGDLVPALKDLKSDIRNMLNKPIAAVEEENDPLDGVLKIPAPECGPTTRFACRPARHRFYPDIGSKWCSKRPCLLVYVV